MGLSRKQKTRWGIALGKELARRDFSVTTEKCEYCGAGFPYRFRRGNEDWCVKCGCGHMWPETAAEIRGISRNLEGLVTSEGPR